MAHRSRARRTAEQPRDARFSLVLAVDSINADLRRIIEYLNTITHDHVRVMAVELVYSKHGDVEMLVPSTCGYELASSKGSREGTGRGGWRPRWQLNDVRTALGEADEALSDGLAKLLEEVANQGVEPVGTRAQSPSLILKKDFADGPVWPIAFYSGPSPYAQLNCQWLAPAGEIRRNQFVEALAEIFPAVVDADAIREADFRRRPRVDLDFLADEQRTLLVEALKRL